MMRTYTPWAPIKKLRIEPLADHVDGIPPEQQWWDGKDMELAAYRLRVEAKVADAAHSLNVDVAVAVVVAVAVAKVVSITAMVPVVVDVPVLVA